MKIHLDSLNLAALQADKSKAAKTGTANEPNAPDTTAALGHDHAELSLSHAQIAGYAAQIRNLPEIRQEKVSALHLAVSNGDYNVSPEQTAGAMLTEWLGGVA